METNPRELAAVDTINGGIKQLNAMLMMVYGGGSEHFRGSSEELQDCYLWACHEKLVEIERAWKALLPILPGSVPR